MKIVTKKPWFWGIVQYFYPDAHWGKVVLAFGDTIYSQKYPLSKAEMAHEEVHLRQHLHSKFVAFFLAIYSRLNIRYYLRCEIEAYKAQNEVERNPEMYARHLSSPVYNNIISYEDALKLFI